jgi:hypothetical protein
MNGVDWIALAGGAWVVRRGYRRGLGVELIRLLRLVLALVAGTSLYGVVAGLLDTLPLFDQGLSRPVGFVGTTAGAWMLLSRMKRWAAGAVEARCSPRTIRVGGAVTAGAKAVFALTGLVATVNLSPAIPFHRAVTEESRLGHTLATLLPNQPEEIDNERSDSTTDRPTER